MTSDWDRGSRLNTNSQQRTCTVSVVRTPSSSNSSMGSSCDTGEATAVKSGPVDSGEGRTQTTLLGRVRVPRKCRRYERLSCRLMRRLAGEINATNSASLRMWRQNLCGFNYGSVTGRKGGKGAASTPLERDLQATVSTVVDGEKTSRPLESKVMSLDKEGGKSFPKGRVIDMESGQWESTLCAIASRPNVIKNISERNYFDRESCACLYLQRGNEEEIGSRGVAMTEKWSSVLNPSFCDTAMCESAENQIECQYTRQHR